MNVENMRQAVISVYAGPAWRMRVQEMEDRQVIAIFKSMVEEGRLNKSGKLLMRPSQPKRSNPLLKEQDDSIQMTIWDYMDKEK